MRQLFLDTLVSEYDRDRFNKFVLNFFNEINLQDRVIPVAPQFLDHIENLTYLGNYEDKDNKKLHVLEVKLKSGSKIDQARTMQRNLIARYLKDHWLDGAFVAFYSDDSTSWRLSFVKVEYKFDENGKTKEELSPAKRYSFLVGKHEPSHTAQQQLERIYNETEVNPTLEQIEKAFGVEKVTKEFFEQYRKLFEDLLEELNHNHTFINEAERNNIDPENFAKKLLGQIVFLYFLQKKGWLGVPKGKSWGEGDKFFLRNIFKQAISQEKNFFNNYLESLFYDTLNNPRSNKVDRNYSDFFESKIPFLNGGLFEPQYDWKNCLIYLDNKIFGKIFDVFDLYNFTVKEDEPLEKEVAVDPEMLGKVFENLLAENLRKGKGTYYTPREIVHYMCQESLINYLVSETNLSEESIRQFVTQIRINGYEIPDEIKQDKEKIKEALQTVKVVDPACGSGAFLVGMLQEIVRAYLELDPDSTEYQVKKETIQNSIYGVDIDTGAVEIAKLRLWLSLVVDYSLEEIEPLPNLDYKIMQGNSLLEELVLGDTTIRLFDQQGVQKAVGMKMKNLFELENPTLFDDDKDKVLKEMKGLQRKYFSQSDPVEKKKIREQIEKIEHQLIETCVKSEVENLNTQRINIRALPGIGLLPDDVKRLEKISSKESQIWGILNELKRTGTKPFFLWHLYFADVFEDNGGFDIVIANPPYGLLNKKQNKSIGHQIATDTLNRLKKYTLYKPAMGGMVNVFRLFICLGIDLLNENGHSSLIFPMAFMGDLSASGVRKYILENFKVKYIEAFPERDNENKRVFEAVKMSVCILGVNRVKDSTNRFPLRIHWDRYVDINNKAVLLSRELIKDFDPLSFTIPLVNKQELEIVNKIRAKSVRLEEVGKCYTGEIDLTIDKKYLTKNTSQTKMIKGAQVQKYSLLDHMSQGEIMYLKEDEYKKSTNSDRSTHNMAKRIVMQGITGINEKTRLKMTIIDSGIYCANSVNYLHIDDLTYDIKYLLGVMNSKINNWFYKKMSTNSNVNGYEVDNLPVATGKETLRLKIIEIVNEMLKRKSNYCSGIGNRDISQDEKDIDKLFYEYYGLDNDEIELVENIR